VISFACFSDESSVQMNGPKKKRVRIAAMT